MPGGQENNWVRGGIYLAKLNPAKNFEVGKVRPVVLLSAQYLLNQHPFMTFICPLSRHSKPTFEPLHVQLPPREALHVESYALVEHCRSIGTHRIASERLATLTKTELKQITQRLQRLISI